jgi:hypothetical protein
MSILLVESVIVATTNGQRADRQAAHEWAPAITRRRARLDRRR